MSGHILLTFQVTLYSYFVIYSTCLNLTWKAVYRRTCFYQMLNQIVKSCASTSCKARLQHLSKLCLRWNACFQTKRSPVWTQQTRLFLRHLVGHQATVFTPNIVTWSRFLLSLNSNFLLARTICYIHVLAFCFRTAAVFGLSLRDIKTQIVREYPEF